MYLNKVFIAGNLTRDPEMKSLPSGAKVTSFSIATNRYWRDPKTNERKEQTEYHNIVVFGRPAETSNQYLRKGSEVLIEGRLQTRSWDGQDGKKNYRTEIVADGVQFGNKSGGGASMPSTQGSPDSVNKGQGMDQSGPEDMSGGAIDYPDDDFNPEDIPF